MQQSHWESSYRREREKLSTPTPLEKKILADISAVKPIHSAHRKVSQILSRVVSGCCAITIAVILLQPAQYLGAAQGQKTPQQDTEADRLDKLRPELALIQAKTDAWQPLRTEVEAGDFVGLCAQWRVQKRNVDTVKLPDDLAAQARKHCRILP